MFRGTYSYIFLFFSILLSMYKGFGQNQEVNQVFQSYLETISPDSDFRAIQSLETRYLAKDSTNIIELVQYSQSPNLKASYTYVDSTLVYKFSFDGVRVQEKGPLSPENTNPERIKLMEDLRSPFIELSDTDIAIYQGMVKLGESQFHKIQLPNNTELFYDVKSNLKTKQISHIQSTDGLVDQTIEYLDYINCDGILLPSKLQISVGDQTLVYELTGFKINPILRKSIFN